MGHFLASSLMSWALDLKLCCDPPNFRNGERQSGQEHLRLPYVLRANSSAVLRVRSTASHQGRFACSCAEKM